MKTSYDKNQDRPITSLNGKIKSLKSSYKLPNVNLSQTNFISTHEENKNIEYETINLHKLTNERDKYFIELQKYKENHEETRKYYEFTKNKAKEKENILRKKISVVHQKLKTKDLDLLKDQMSSMGIKIFDDIKQIDKEKKREIKKGKMDMDSKISLKLMDIENKGNNNNGKAFEKEMKNWEEKYKEMQKIKENANKIYIKKENLIKSIEQLKLKVEKKEEIKHQLKHEIADLMIKCNLIKEEKNDTFLLKNKMKKLKSLTKINNIVKNQLLSDEAMGTIELNKNNEISFKKVNSKEKHVQNIKEILKPHIDLSKYIVRNLSIRPKLFNLKKDNKEKGMFKIRNENIFTSRRQSQNTDLTILKEEENLNLSNLKDKKFKFYETNEKISDLSNKISNYSRDIKNRGYQDSELNKFKINLEQRVFKKNVISNVYFDRNQLNELKKEKQFDSLGEKNSIFNSEKNESFSLNNKINLKHSFDAKLKKLETPLETIKRYSFIEEKGNFFIDRLMTLLDFVTNFLTNLLFVKENPRLASTLASYANMLNNLKIKINGIKKDSNFNSSQNKMIYKEIHEMISKYREEKIQKINLKTKNLLVNKVKEGMTLTSYDTKEFIDLIINSKKIKENYQNYSMLNSSKNFISPRVNERNIENLL